MIRKLSVSQYVTLTRLPYTRNGLKVRRSGFPFCQIPKPGNRLFLIFKGGRVHALQCRNNGIYATVQHELFAGSI